MIKESRSTLIWMALVFIFILIIQNFWLNKSSVESIPYSEFEALLKNNQVDNLTITEKYIQGEFRTERVSRKTHFVTNRVTPELSAELSASGVKYTQGLESTFLRDLLSWTIPALLFFALWIFISRRMVDRGGLGGMMAVGKSKAKLYVETDIKTTFADVAGVDEAKNELEEVVQFLRDPAAYSRLGARMPKGILLVGPPGTGKTLLAKAVAGEAKVPFFSISGSEFVELFVGVGAARVRDLFAQARTQAPCIIFIDELDALGKRRAPGIISGGHDEKEQTLNQLLAELDGFDTQLGVILLAATNRPEILDPALLRAGRFDRQVLVDRPDKKGRQEILEVHVKKIKALGRMDLEHIASLTSGFTGADLANLVNEAALVATRRNAETVDEIDFVAAIERLVAGLEKRNRIMTEKEKRIVAFHEMGHALVAWFMPSSDRVQKISIIPRGIGALGFTMQRPTEDRYLLTKDELMAKISILMGGRMAESLIFGEVSTGAADDLVKVTNLAEAIVMKYGMSPVLGNVVFERPTSGFIEDSYFYENRRSYSEESAKAIDLEIRNLLQEASSTAARILEQNRSLLEKGAHLLLEKETLNEADILKIFPPKSFIDFDHDLSATH